MYQACLYIGAFREAKRIESAWIRLHPVPQQEPTVCSDCVRRCVETQGNP